MKNKEIRGILALAVVTALSFGVIIGSNALSQDMAGEADGASSAVTEEFDTAGSENIDSAAKTEDGYLVTVREKGYGGDIVMNVAFEADAATISGVEVVEQAETEGLGARIAESEFLDQFKGAAAPVALPGMNVNADGSSEENEADPVLEALEGAALTDGSYEASTGEYDDSGFMDEVSLTVEDGKITEVVWEAVTEDGSKKSVMSEEGEYVMTEDGPTWKEQAEALAEALIEQQSLSFLTTDEQGKTDAVSGVSISVGGFISLTEQCLAEAAGIDLEEVASQESSSQETEEGSAAGTSVEAVSGATVSSTAAVTAINNAYQFLQTVK